MGDWNVAPPSRPYSEDDYLPISDDYFPISSLVSISSGESSGDAKGSITLT